MKLTKNNIIEYALLITYSLFIFILIIGIILGVEIK